MEKFSKLPDEGYSVRIIAMMNNYELKIVKGGVRDEIEQLCNSCTNAPLYGRWICDLQIIKYLGEVFFNLHLVGFCQVANFSEDESIIECK